jgi:hypothetical protein
LPTSTFDAKKNDEAEKIIRAALKEQPDLSRIWHWLASWS